MAQVWVSCGTTKDLPKKNQHSALSPAEKEKSDEEEILCTFAGDIMAHVVNVVKGNYAEIYRDIEPYLKESDLAFANLEVTVDDDLPYSAYPNFNVHHEYPDGAMEAGFSVFSLANNHTNDHGKEGIISTRDYFKKRHEENASKERPVWYNGLCEKKGEPFTPTLIQRGKWKILFLAVTEVVNRKTYLDWFYNLGTSEKEREDFIKKISMIRKENPCDFFVLSFHCADAEYKRTIDESQRKYYRALLEAGVDVLWANHPHVSKNWEVIADENQVPRKIIFFAQGNTISGQRQEVEFDNPDAKRAYTGDGYITQVRFTKEQEKIKITLVNPILITTYITPDWFFEIRKLNDEFLEELENEGRHTWAKYLSERKKRMEKVEGKLIWQ